MSFPKVSVRRSSIDGDTTDMAVLEFNVKVEVVQESFIYEIIDEEMKNRFM